MKLKLLAAAVSVAVLVPSALAVTSVIGAPAPPGPSASVNYGTPQHDGTSKTKFTIKYTDPGGTTKRKDIEVAVPVNGPDPSSGEGGDTAAEKRQKIQDALDAELAKDANKVGGQVLASTSGGADQLGIHPSGDNPGAGFSNVHITKPKPTDEGSGEVDKSWDGTNAAALIVMEMEGTITGVDGSGGPSVLNVSTSAGSAVVALSGSMRWADVVEAVASALRGPCGAVTWSDLDAHKVYVLLDMTTITSAGIGSTDAGLRVSALNLSSVVD